MYLSDGNTMLLSNGNFIIFSPQSLKPDQYPYITYEISPFAKGLNIKINKYDRLSCSNHTGDICLINLSHNNNRKLPIHNFLSDIPVYLLILR